MLLLAHGFRVKKWVPNVATCHPATCHPERSEGSPDGARKKVSFEPYYSIFPFLASPLALVQV